MSKAGRLLASSGVHPVSTEVIDQLVSLHPSRYPSPSLPLAPDLTVPIVSVDPKLIAKIVRKGANGSGGGPSGWSYDLLLPLVNNQDALCGLCALITLIVNARIPPGVWPLLLASRLVPLKKSDDGVRPIAIGEVFVSLCSSYLVHEFQGSCSEYFSPIQFGVSSTRGVEKVLHKDMSIPTLNMRSFLLTWKTPLTPSPVPPY